MVKEEAALGGYTGGEVCSRLSATCSGSQGFLSIWLLSNRSTIAACGLEEKGYTSQSGGRGQEGQR